MIRMSAFAGEVPRLIPRLLSENQAQVAENVRVERGDLLPIRNNRYVTSLETTGGSFFKLGSKWMGWAGADVKVVAAPIAEDRYYIFGDGLPKVMQSDGSIYDVAIPVPPQPLSVFTESEIDDKLSFTVIYTWTWVTSMGEESLPADISMEITVDPKTTVNLGNFPTAVPANRGIDSIRIYRSQSGTSGDTQFFMVSEIGAADVVESGLVVDFIGAPLSATILPSGSYVSPPNDLKGAVALPNGFMAAFRGKELYFSEPYLPHAWPQEYIQTVDSEIVGLGVFGSSLAIMTKGMPYIAQGTLPENMTASRLDVNLPCVTPRGIVDMGYSVAYPSPYGLVMISGNGAQVVSSPLFTTEQWRMMQPESLVCSQFSGRYIASYNYLSEAGVETRGLMMIDITSGTPFLVRVPEQVTAMFYELGSGQLYLLKEGKDIYEFDALSQNYGQYHWRSKKFVLNTLTNFACVLVEGGFDMSAGDLAQIEKDNQTIRDENQQLIDNMVSGGSIAEEAIGITRIAGSLIRSVVRNVTVPGGEGGSGTDPGGDYTDLPSNLEPAFEISIFGDGNLLFTGRDLNDIMWLPADGLYRTWEIDVRSNMSITGITLAYSPEEIGSAG